jgi:hypothetical protein
MYQASVVSLSVFVALFSSSRSQTPIRYMRDLGYPEPNWGLFKESESSEPALTVNSTSQYWGSIQPESSGNEPLCKWFAGPENSGHGSCKTDISWLHSAVGFKKEFFEDPLANYVLRFHLNGACYRSTQVRSTTYSRRRLKYSWASVNI